VDDGLDEAVGGQLPLGPLEPEALGDRHGAAQAVRIDDVLVSRA
jgi:hypothetical protein